MTASKIFIILLCISCCFCYDRLLVDELARTFLKIENDLWNLTQNHILEKCSNDAEMYVVKKFYEFDQRLKQMPEDILRGLNPETSGPRFLYLYGEMMQIHNLYEKFREYQKTIILKSTDNRIPIEDMIYDITNKNYGARILDEKMYNLTHIVPGNVFEELKKVINEDGYWCKQFEQSPNLLLYNFYNAVSLIQLKAYVLQQFAHIGNRLWEAGKNMELSVIARKTYQKRYLEFVRKLQYTNINYLKGNWKCDPKVFVEGQNFAQFTRLLQGVIQNEVDMSKSRTCTKKCNDYSFTKSYGCYDYKSEFCRKVEKCNGDIIGCHFVEAKATICVSDSPKRRYDYIQYRSGKKLGEKSYCPNSRSANSWTRWFVRCHICMCLCDEYSLKSDRFISLMPVRADIENNRVVTGFRLYKLNRILHIQIQEGKLLPYGYIHEKTVHWVPVHNFTITSPGIFNGKQFYQMDYSHRSMALDEIRVHDRNYIVTGLQFNVIKQKIHFGIHVSRFDWKTGEIRHGDSHNIYEINPGIRTKINLSNAHIPTKTTKPSRRHYNAYSHYVEFTHTDYVKDVAQTTIPFIDSQEVVNKPAVPLEGAGIYYKGNEGFGGFIAPIIRSYDYGIHYATSLPTMEKRSDLPE